MIHGFVVDERWIPVTSTGMRGRKRGGIREGGEKGVGNNSVSPTNINYSTSYSVRNIRAGLAVNARHVVAKPAVMVRAMANRAVRRAVVKEKVHVICMT